METAGAKPKGFLFSFIRTISCVSCFLMAVPILLFCEGMSVQNPDSRLIYPMVGMHILCGFVGFFVSFLVSHSPIRSNLIRNSIRFACTSLALSGGIWLEMLYLEPNFPYNLFIGLVFPLSCGAVYVFGSIIYFADYSEILTRKVLMAYMIPTFGAFFMLRVMGQSMPDLTVVVWCFIFIMFSYLLASNQGNIDFVMERRSHSMSSLPPRIRYYNLTLLGVVFAVIVLVFLFKNQIGFAVQSLFDFLANLMERFALWWASLGQAAESSEAVVSATPTPTPEPDVLEGGQGRPYYFLYVVVAAMFVGIFVLYGGALIRALKEKLQRLSDKLLTVLGKVHKRKKRAAESEYYYDLDEVVRADEATPEKEDKPAAVLRQWKKKIRQYEKLPDGAGKFRMGYGLLIEGLTLKKYPILTSDTPLELTEKVLSLVELPMLDTLTQCYDLIRYAQNSEDGDCELLRLMLRRLENMHPLAIPEHGKLL